MKIKNKKTGVVWEIDEGSPAAKRVKEQLDDYEMVTDDPPKLRSKKATE